MSELSHSVVLCLALLKNSALSYHSCFFPVFRHLSALIFLPPLSLPACHLFCASFGHNAIGLPFTNQLTLLSPSAFLLPLSLPAPSTCHCVFAFIIFLYSYLFFFVFFSYNFTCFFFCHFQLFLPFPAYSLFSNRVANFRSGSARPSQPIDMQFVAQL